MTAFAHTRWNSFARRKLRHEFRIYFLYFVSYFISTYLDVGDTLVGMPVGGYSSPISFRHQNWQENLRDLGKVTCSIINAYYTVQEYRSYRKCGSLRIYFRDGWNWFDLLQICCVWLLFGTEIAALSDPNLLTTDAYELVVTEESYYNRRMWRRYKLRTTLLSIVGPQIFIKWIQFARGNQVFGPFVRMIFKMFRDILVFFIVFCVFLFGFAFAFFILQLEGFRSYLSAITSVFQLSVGSWDWERTIMLLNLLIAMLGNTYDNIWEDRLLFYELERAKATLAIQTSLNDDEYDEQYWCRRLYVLEGDAPIEGIQLQKF
ncbi:unnamed protein product [Albugo candida]|uniref:Polycystin cation channel PKD1/PKD2 domain-containing protein n=1 Tax=Albugo candida TaxID=65357 RepID=A0A024FYJ9_9STRA|nr:unnamed protein product [Albugo candida]|eukprot:CCI39363.1 unnamed protein product [Albugo candida]